MPKFYGERPYTKAQLESVCKHCGNAYAEHRSSDDGCPLFDDEGNRLYAQHSKTQFFEPRETFL